MAKVHWVDHPAAAMIVSKGIPFLNAAEVEAAQVLCGLRFTVSLYLLAARLF